ncbi:unnamed protein product [Strongylus vulgaris]|uniref:Hemicentin-1-like von Willebrand factor A domain-containing protein n=1 Tax=Strongylus vulgaris TaxID=40348 RepID=A0A3P7IWC3_STRVU|nr:unnamed protein product [Strongylus vulgaris]
MGQADAFDEYIVSTFNTITLDNEPHPQVLVTPYTSVTAFLNATTSAAIMYQYSQSITQPSMDALWQTIHSTSYDKSSIFLFTDASPTDSTTHSNIPNIVLAAIERQLQINVIITAPYQMNSLCIPYANASVYAQIALQTGGTILNLCQTYENTYPRDIITEQTDKPPLKNLIGCNFDFWSGRFFPWEALNVGCNWPRAGIEYSWPRLMSSFAVFLTLNNYSICCYL